MEAALIAEQTGREEQYSFCSDTKNNLQIYLWIIAV